MTHATHDTQYSDSSLYDAVCKKCGATDGFGDKRLNYPCPKADGPSHEGPLAQCVGVFTISDLTKF